MSAVSVPPSDGDRNRALELIAVTWTWCIISIVFVALRFYSRIRLTNNVWWDDWFILITVILTITFSALWVVLAENNGCRHLYYLTPEQAAIVIKIDWISQPFAIMALATGKISVAFLILRLLGRGTVRKVFLYFTMGANFIFCALASIFTFVQCDPPKALWTPSLQATAKCWKPSSQSNFSIFVGSYLAFTDLALAILPMTIICRLQISTKKKWTLCTLLGSGIFAFICAIVKTTKLTTLNARSDLTWETVTLWIWNANEINYVIIAACIPTLRPLFLILFNRPGREAYIKRYNHSGYPNDRSKKSNVASSSVVEFKILESQTADKSWFERGRERHALPAEDVSPTIEIDMRYPKKREDSAEEVFHQDGEKRAASHDVV